MKKLLFVAIFAIAFVTMRGQGYTTLGVGINQPVGTLHVHSSSPVITPEEPNLIRDVMDYVADGLLLCGGISW